MQRRPTILTGFGWVFAALDATLLAVNRHAAQQPAAVGLNDLGRLAQHPRTSLAQPRDQIRAVADGGKLNRAAVRQDGASTTTRS